ncbi:MAG: LysM peptidoglycan-binding domain-containing protein, partial [Bacteroidota bacterium]
MKKSLLLLFLFCSAVIAFSQNELMVRSNDKGLYLKHTVAAKENFFSVGRLYNVPAKDIAAYNSVDMNHGLAIGQEINIPLNAANFIQSEKKGRPVYYLVGEKEGLYRVSVKHNKVLMANLRSWNHLADDNITTGKKLIVGYLNSTEANTIVQKPAPAATEKKSSPEIKKDVVITDVPK